MQSVGVDGRQANTNVGLRNIGMPANLGCSTGVVVAWYRHQKASKSRLDLQKEVASISCRHRWVSTDLYWAAGWAHASLDDLDFPFHLVLHFHW